jgi:hypothetical protein
MQIIKIIIGIFIGICAIKVMVQMASEESGAGLLGAVIGFLIIGGLAGWLIYSGINGRKK